jgi:SAM-dependent methyltransferase
MQNPALDVSERNDPIRFAVNAFVRKIAEGVAEGARVLDAGAGECIYRPLFSRRRYIAVDRAIGDGGWDYGHLDATADLGRLPFPDASFDWAICTETLEHLARPREALNEIRRILRPGGGIAISVPFLQPLHQEPHDYFRYTPHGLRAMLADAGFGSIQIETSGGYFALLHAQLRDLPFHIPLGLGASSRSWLSWPVRGAIRAGALVVRALTGGLRRRESSGTRPLQVFARAFSVHCLPPACPLAPCEVSYPGYP